METETWTSSKPKTAYTLSAKFDPIIGMESDIPNIGFQTESKRYNMKVDYIQNLAGKQ